LPALLSSLHPPHYLRTFHLTSKNPSFHRELLFKMLASPLSPSHPAYIPPKPSPLSPGSVNISSRTPIFGASGASVPAKSPAQSQPDSKRAHKPVPTLTSSEALSKQRRERFLRDVQRKREDRRWAERCDYV